MTCPNCGRTTLLEWENEKDGRLQVCIWDLISALQEYGLLPKGVNIREDVKGETVETRTKFTDVLTRLTTTETQLSDVQSRLANIENARGGV